jgi:hypothetical protein
MGGGAACCGAVGQLGAGGQLDEGPAEACDDASPGSEHCPDDRGLVGGAEVAQVACRRWEAGGTRVVVGDVRRRWVCVCAQGEGGCTRVVGRP